MMKRTLLILMLCAWAPGLVAAEPFAYVVGALATTGPATIVQQDTLFQVDLASGEALLIGRLEDVASPGTYYTKVTALEILYPAGVLYGVDDSTRSLITIDTDTGAATLVGPISDFITGQPIPSIAAFGMADFWLISRQGRRFGRLDPTNARWFVQAAGGTEVPDSEAMASGPGSANWGLWDRPAGDYELFLIQKVLRGEGLPGNFVVSHGIVSPQIGLTGLGLDTAADGTVWGIGRDSTGPAELFQLDPIAVTVGGFTDITVPATGQVVVNTYSLAIIGEPVSVPALSPAMLTGLGASLLLLGSWLGFLRLRSR